MNKEEQKKLLTEIMDADTKDGLYEPTVSKMETTQQKDHIGDTNKMVTAVEWLINDLIERDLIKKDDYIKSFIDKSLEQAKGMEKEQIEQAYIDSSAYSLDSEQYYNYKYKK